MLARTFAPYSNVENCGQRSLVINTGRTRAHVAVRVLPSAGSLCKAACFDNITVLMQTYSRLSFPMRR